SLISQGKWGDDDGDGQGTNGVTATGSISLAIKDKNGSTVNRSDTLDICKAPYKVTLDSTGGSLTTQYGVPNSSRFYGGSAVYYITLPSRPVICSVRPNLLYGGASGIISYDDPRFAGPSSIWSPTKGFLVQSTSPSSYNLNFPTTGADGLYFDLDVGGLDVTQLTWPSVTHSGITATVAVVTANETWIPSVDRGKRVTRVTLRGPRASRSQISSSPGRITRPVLPQDFELVGRDRSGNGVRYGFKLRQWFVHRSNNGASASNQTAWCRSLGYRMPRVSDLTNATCSGWNSGSDCQGAVGATPSSGNNVYQRRIGAGFFTEWGNMHNYAGAGFDGSYWTSDAIGSSQFNVYSSDGHVSSYGASYSIYAVCTTP
ncbi:hypothetical protein, partial [Gilliamella sp. Gris1-4]|uniref:hypothetical protein n=1 Tax=Gilliamella sp. Gris1-4 TaxID=3120244 RepID=UPI00159EC889